MNGIERARQSRSCDVTENIEDIDINCCQSCLVGISSSSESLSKSELETICFNKYHNDNVSLSDEIKHGCCLSAKPSPDELCLMSIVKSNTIETCSIEWFCRIKGQMAARATDYNCFDEDQFEKINVTETEVSSCLQSYSLGCAQITEKAIEMSIQYAIDNGNFDNDQLPQQIICGSCLAGIHEANHNGTCDPEVDHSMYVSEYYDVCCNLQIETIGGKTSNGQLGCRDKKP